MKELRYGLPPAVEVAPPIAEKAIEDMTVAEFDQAMDDKMFADKGYSNDLDDDVDDD